MVFLGMLRSLTGNRIELDQHLRSAFHSDEARLRRAEKIGEEKAMAKEDSK